MNIIQYTRLKNREAPLSTDELNILIQKAQAGDVNSRNIVVERNIGLVLRIAGKQYIKDAYDREDYFQEGVFGLIRAVEKFDVSRGFAFSTYAEAWIVSMIQRYRTEREPLIRVPVYAVEIKNCYAKLRQDNPNDSEDELFTKLKEKYPRASEKNINDLMKHNVLMGSMNVPSESGESLDLTDEGESFKNDLLLFDVQLLMKNLSFREQRVISRRLGGETLQVISETEGVSRERIRQIYEDSYKQMQLMYNFRKA